MGRSVVGNQQLFVIGCERSGTTPLVRLLNAHPNVAVGMERYKYVLREMRRTRHARLLTAEHFERERFLDFRETDTNLIPPNFGDLYQRITEHFDQGRVAFVGDKVMPPDTFLTLALADSFPDARFIFIFRDLLRVASSFNVRAQNPLDSWPAQNDHQQAYRHWCESFDAADALIDRVGDDRVFVVSPERLFRSNGLLCGAMFQFLDLEPDEFVDQFFTMIRVKWQLRLHEPLALDRATQDSLLAGVDGARLARYQEMVDSQVATQFPVAKAG
jgi:Sulfotransferase family